jgi:excisionase family DNA binding protein
MAEWLTIIEAAHYLKMSVPGIRKYVRNGKLPSYRQGRIIRLKQSDLDAFLSPAPVEPPKS